MFKLIGMAVGVGLVLCLGIAIFGPSNTKAIQSALIEEPSVTLQDKADTENQETENQLLPESKDKKTQNPGIESKNTEPVDTRIDEVIPDFTTKDQIPPSSPSETEKHQYVFWKPFTTQASAYGFAETLTQQTGVEMSVISHKFNSHSVLFYYDNEAEKDDILALIKEKTGLNLGDSI